MKRNRVFVVLLACLLSGTWGCLSAQEEHRRVAQAFAEQLSRCANNPTAANQEQLARYCSAYTFALLQNAEWVERLAVQGDFEYRFVADSLSPDRTKVFVWFANAASGAPEAVQCLELRQSLDGWLVDMPLW